MNLKSRISAKTIAFIVTIAVASTATRAVAQHGDLMFSLNSGDLTKIDAGVVDFNVAILQLSGHVAHEIEVPHLGPGIPAEADLEPGVNSLQAGLGGALDIAPNSALPGNVDLDFKFVSYFNPEVGGGVSGNLFYWDYVANPLGPVWEATPAGHTLALEHDLASLPLVGSASVDGSDTDVAGFTIATTDPVGGIHQHIDTLVSGPGGDPLLGIYAAAIEVETPGAKSDPLFLLAGVFDPNFDNDQLEAFEEAIESSEEWIDQNYDVLVGGSAPAQGTPEPSALLLASIGLMSIALLVPSRAWVGVGPP